jgi:pSer/pThr/pTyr-binding forkhead associated (FHA) protein
MARIILEHDGQVLKDFPFHKGSVTIGRRRENIIVFHDPQVSGFHARIDKRGAEFILTDLQSTNGTFVNNRKIVSHRLSHGDRITVSKYTLLFVGTEKAKMDADDEAIPLDRTVILGGAAGRRRHSPAPTAAEHVSTPRPYSDGLRGRLILLFGLVAIIAGAGIFSFRDKIPLIRKSILHDKRVGRIERRPLPAIPRQTGPEELQRDLTDEFNAPGGNSALALEAIIWSSDQTKSFAVINGKTVKTGEPVEGMMVAGIGRDYVLLRSQDGQSTLRLTLTLK